MIEYENRNVKEIDKRILEQIQKNLNIKEESVDILSKEKLKEYLTMIDEKKEVISLLFQGDFSINEKNIECKIKDYETKITPDEQVVNNIISKRVETIIEQMIKKDEKNGRLVSVCMDRMLFIKRIIQNNIGASLIKSCIEDEMVK